MVVLHFPALLVTDLQVVKTLSDRLIYQRTVVATCNIVYQTEYICMVFIRHLTLLLPFVVQYHFTWPLSVTSLRWCNAGTKVSSNASRTCENWDMRCPAAVQTKVDCLTLMATAKQRNHLVTNLGVSFISHHAALKVKAHLQHSRDSCSRWTHGKKNQKGIIGTKETQPERHSVAG